MKLFNLARFATMGIAAMAIAGLASAQGLTPRKQWALITDTGNGGCNGGSVHRLDVYNGSDHGSFGQGNLTNPVGIAVQPSTGVAYVAEQGAIKRFDPVSGAYLGAIVNSVGTGFAFEAIRFDSAGDLYVVLTQNFGMNYRLIKLDPATGGLLGASVVKFANSFFRMSLGFRPSGEVEVGHIYTAGTDDPTNDANYVDYFAASTQFEYTLIHPTGFTAPFQIFRTSDDTYIRWQIQFDGYQWTNTLTCGTGVLGSWLPVEKFDVNTDFQILFAESFNHETYALQKQQGTFHLRGYDTKGVAVKDAIVNLGAFQAGNLTGMAIFIK